MEFTFGAYKRLIETIIKNGYQVSSYKNVEEYDKTVILRHDIDFSPSNAINIARIESELGVKSIYFVLISTEFYNVFSKETFELLKQILEMGHEIGLHFDEQRYNINSLEQMKDYVSKEVSILQNALDTEVNVVSMHRPSRFVLNNNIKFKNLINSYNKKYFEEMKYISDSRMYWREDVMDILNSNKYNKLHILTHPFWYSEKSDKIQDKLLKFISDGKLIRYNNLNSNFKNLGEYINLEDIV